MENSAGFKWFQFHRPDDVPTASMAKPLVTFWNGIPLFFIWHKSYPLSLVKGRLLFPDFFLNLNKLL
jgi:hypothetical protein